MEIGRTTKDFVSNSLYMAILEPIYNLVHSSITNSKFESVNTLVWTSVTNSVFDTAINKIEDEYR